MKSDQIRQAIDMPWIIAYELRRWFALPYIRLMFSLQSVRWGRRWQIWGMPIIQRYRGSRIEIGDGVNLRSWWVTNPLVPYHPVVFATRSSRAMIRIGNDVGMTGATIVAAECVEIGDRVFIGANATIVDTDFHPLDPMKRQRDVLAGEHAAVRIESDVFIGMNALVLKGVNVGQGAVVGAGSVVVRDVPPHMIVAGNPARVIRQVERNREGYEE